ncbi:hypothetical protein HMPREF9622_01527 [Cutibacterium modestum HL037PA3]|uniref:Uncharacterized protein n=1 Tax=Cutibacterium modestum HL044PA1 TaxID=765109 RepID=A0ABN0C389_9ACTN|nr:hypothetical protein HMPREF9621_01687 [Cutibacterium modestum HL037PA2]EFS91516.1 hypothetical protein HMPREF9607_02313 [Cutibacterium modestum HL044PA1]EFT15425.1 hypothetical protein HMPREF9622_01527 [Cutibacterium modestum HL037PA3]
MGAVTDSKKTDLRAVKVLLNDHSVTGAETPFSMGESLGAIVRDDDSLPPGQTIVLDHIWCPELVEGSRDGIDVVTGTGSCRRHASGDHHLFSEGFRPFQSGSLGTWTEAVDSSIAQSVSHPGDQGSFRADDDEISLQVTRQGDDGVTIARIQWVVRGEGCRSRVTGSNVDGDNIRITMAS